jgi:hypothetical protein
MTTIKIKFYSINRNLLCIEILGIKFVIKKNNIAILTNIFSGIVNKYCTSNHEIIFDGNSILSDKINFTIINTFCILRNIELKYNLVNKYIQIIKRNKN